jgi:predicted nucleic acid-binding protein
MSAPVNTNVIVIDASVSLAQVLPLTYSPQVETRMACWEKEHTRIIVPALWEYEVVSGLRRAWVNKILTAEMAHQALQFLLGLCLETIPGSPERHRQALEWAQRVGQSRACDAQYLVIAHELAATLWTGDQRLVHAAHQIDLAWVRWVGED